MRRRSSRLFVVLLHLVGISTNFYNNNNHNNNSGVNPEPIVLEELDLQKFEDGLKGLLRHAAKWRRNGDEILLSEPYWFKDDVDGKCLGPTGFSECGDATLWRVRRKPASPPSLSSKRRFRWLQRRSNDNGKEHGFALELVEEVLTAPTAAAAATTNTTVIRTTTDSQIASSSSLQVVVSQRLLPDSSTCLVRRYDRSVVDHHRRKDGESSSTIGIGSCNILPQKQVWTWTVDQEGVLSRQKTTRRRRRTNKSAGDDATTNVIRQCLRRRSGNHTTTTILSSSCHDGEETEGGGDHEKGYLVQFSMVRYMPTPLGSSSPEDEEEEKTPPQPEKPQQAPGISQQLRRSTDLAHSHADASTRSVPSPPVSTSATANRPIHRMGSATSKTKQQPTTRSVLSLRDSNPILFVGLSGEGDDDDETPVATTTTTNDMVHKKKKSTRTMSPTSTTTSMTTTTTTSSTTTTTLTKTTLSSSSVQGHNDGASSSKFLRMQTHPYLATAKDGVWTDPKTKLEYLTDLCEYLGHDRKESGRHTLLGVGQYTKNFLGYPAKIYGIALYVSKRDALADPTFEAYAHKTADELRVLPEVYKHLRSMPGHLPNRGMVDRTLLLKLNMALSTETMRSSLASDWKLLTQELKDLLINSSLKPRPAEPAMLETILSEANPGRCSCGQVAPPEFKADITCCSRGTELVFTWRKNGDLEIRVDGRVMDIFPRPGAAQGIFFEYLRYDSPMSIDFRDRVMDGLPFLLGPLAQVKGVTSLPPMPPKQVQQSGPEGILKAVGGLADRVTSHAGQLTEWVQNAADETSSNVGNAMRAAGDAARTVSQGVDRRREQLWHQITSLHEHGANFLSNRVPPLRDGVSSAWNHVVRRRRKGEEKRKKRSAPRGNVFHSTGTKWFGQGNDPAPHGGVTTVFFTRQVFLYLVHLYLLLLLIVSFPGAHQTISVVRRGKKVTGSDTESEASTESSFEGGEVGAVETDFGSKMRAPHPDSLESSFRKDEREKMTKALSYCL